MAMEKTSESERDLKAVAITKLMGPLPGYRKNFLFMVVLSFLAGFALDFLQTKKLTLSAFGDYFLFGGAEGFLIIGVPAILAGVFASSITRREKFGARLRHFSFVSLISVVACSISYILALLFSQNINQLQTFVLLANSVIFGIWFVALFVGLNYKWRAAPISLIQPALNISFLTIYKSFLIANLQDPFTLGLKFIISTAVLLLALASISYIINAPARRNFGVSTLQVMALFFAQWTYGSKRLEEVLAEMGEGVETFYGTVLFRNSRTRRIKAAWLIPYVHFGPVGNLGGSEFPYLLSKPLHEELKADVGVFHAPVNHDFNPVYSSAHRRILDAYSKEIRNLKRGKFERNLSISLLESHEGTARVLGITAGKGGFFALSNAPNSTEDVEFPIGMIFMDSLKSKGLQQVVLADMHNSKTDGDYMLPGTPEFFEFYDLLGKFKAQKGGRFRFGSFADPLGDLGISQGIGKMGMIASIFETGGRKSCIILLDANNVLPEFRREILLKISEKHRFDFIDVFTTDTHAVNTISGIHNPLGKYCDRNKLVGRIENAVMGALKNMEPAEAAISIKRMGIDVLGARRSPEVISTINSIVSIAKIFAPSILIISLLIAFLLSLSIK
ncbi:MAG: DUF2070 family protein [Candidatus Micrarchaeota archaeon]